MIFVATIPNVSIIGRKNAITSAINPDRKPLYLLLLVQIKIVQSVQ